MRIVNKINEWYNKYSNLVLIPEGGYRSFVPVENIKLETYDLHIFHQEACTGEKGHAFYRFNNDTHEWDFICFQPNEMPILTVKSMKEAKEYGKLPGHELRALKCCMKVKFSWSKLEPYKIIW